MNREILFKAKTTKKNNQNHEFNGKWVEGNLILCGDKAYIHPASNKIDVTGEIGRIIVMHEIDPDTLCQYTGLTDKNGKKIWENDILKANLDESYPEDITYIKILWNECRFSVNENHSTDIWTLEKWDAEHFQVCGNIFDNPDLLEVE